VHTFHGHVLRGYFSRPVTFGFRTLEHWLAKVTTALIAVSPEVRDDLVQLGVAPREKFVVVRLGVELAERVTGAEDARAATRRALGVPDDAFVVGWIGRMTGIKRVPDILRAFRRLLDRGIDAKLCLVGDGPDREAVEQQAHDLGITRHTLFVGYQQDVAPYYAFFDAFVLTSANEGTPVVVIESLAAGRPAVATHVGGVPDVVEAGVDSFLVPVGDPEAVAGALESLARDPDLRARMGAAGRARVIPRYRVERLVDDVDRLYQELLRERGLPPPPGGTRRTTASSSPTR
jgi:glycosyltransferase involved in cell wall biosynthesis